MKPLRVGVPSLAVFLLLASPLSSQVADTLRAVRSDQAQPDTTQAAEELARPISPGGAFLRSALIPGWGHARVGAPGRGAFYFAVESASVFMILKSQSRLTLARNRLALQESVVTARLKAEGIEDPLELEEALAADERVEELRALEEVRSNHREDWIALGIFFLLVGGVDAFVSAHLADFPSPVEVQVQGAPGGPVEVGLSIPVNF